MTLLKPGIPRVERYTGPRTEMPSWVREGENVAVISGGRHGAGYQVAFRPVNRATAKFVVVDGPNETEQRFSLVKGLELAGTRDAYGPRYFLADPNSWAVRFARSEARIANLTATAHQKANDFARKPTPERAMAAEEALKAYRDAHDFLVKAQDTYLEANPK